MANSYGSEISGCLIAEIYPNRFNRNLYGMIKFLFLRIEQLYRINGANYGL